jgi:hypothetical protein
MKKNNDSGKDSSAQVVSLDSARARKGSENRRKMERYFMTHILSSFLELPTADAPDEKWFATPFEEVSETGCSFFIDKKFGKYFETAAAENHCVKFQISFSRDTYILVGFKVVNITPAIIQGTEKYRIGCQVDESFSASEAYRQIVRFVAAYSAHCVTHTQQAGGF